MSFHRMTLKRKGAVIFVAIAAVTGAIGLGIGFLAADPDFTSPIKVSSIT